jgi:hypothetical protein
MPRVVIQPAGNKESRKHFTETVENPVDLNLLKNNSGSEYEKLIKVSEKGKIALWGVTPGKNGANISKYRKLSVGDMVFFTRDKKVYCSGERSHLFENKQLATELWGQDPVGQTWENMYALRNVVRQDIPYSVLRNAIGSNSGDNFMGFRPLDVVKSINALNLIGIQAFEWNISIGEIIKRKKLHEIYGGAGMGGIEPSAKTPNVFIFTYPNNAKKNGYNFDEELEDGTFMYTGDGQIGDQDAEIGGNKAILESRKKGRALRLFEEAEEKTFVRYVGEFELIDSEPIVQRGLDRNGTERNVLVFHLHPVGSTKRLASINESPKTAEVSRHKTEENVGITHIRSLTASHTVATRYEGQLQKRFEDFLKAKALDIGTFKISIPESNAPLRIDLVNFTDNWIIEVKAGIARGYVREAIGQVLDYTFQLKRIKGEVWLPMILLPGKPSEDLMELINNLGIALAWEDGNNFIFA